MVTGFALILLGLILIYSGLEYQRKKSLKLNSFRRKEFLKFNAFRGNLVVGQDIKVRFQGKFIIATIDAIIGRTIFLTSESIPEINFYRFDYNEIYPLNYE